ncbi:MAG: aminotransferase class V-fold PLP-dependent enzyme [Phycisphaerales bacterium]|nr:MAG: aminotransferase class V-fold PLP-dependent enzyme [Phycisphaerales bacterium]
MINLDNNATTQPSPGVVEAVTRGLTECWHNPSSIHRPGQAAKREMELARKRVAELIGARAKEIVFTGSGTEAIDFAVRGLMHASGKRTVITTSVEHSAVRELVKDGCERELFEVRRLPMNSAGVVDADALPGLLDDTVGVVSVQWANNETGAVQPIGRISRLCRERGVPFHCDGTQWVGKLPADVGSASRKPSEQVSLADVTDERADLGALVDVLTFAPHKFYGPKGVGCVWIRRGVRVRPVIHGAQELGRRGGTENVPGIMGAGVACEEMHAWLASPAERQRLGALRDLFERLVLEACPGAKVNGPTGPGARVWNTTNIGFPRLEADAILLLLSERGVCASAGSACASGSLDPSPVLLAMGIDPIYAHGSVRFSLGIRSTEADIREAVEIVRTCIEKLGGSAAPPAPAPAHAARG